jgi:hypothetical protein
VEDEARRVLPRRAPVKARVESAEAVIEAAIVVCVAD